MMNVLFSNEMVEEIKLLASFWLIERLDTELDFESNVLDLTNAICTELGVTGFMYGGVKSIIKKIYKENATMLEMCYGYAF